MGRRELSIVLILVAFSSCSLAQSLGVNFNETIAYAKDPSTIRRTETTWARGFLDFFEYMDEPKKLTSSNGDLQAFLDLQQQDFKTILSLKFRFKKTGIPSPESEEAARYLLFLTKVLDRVWGKVDILVVGNEPFIESKRDEWNSKLPPFYKLLCNYVYAYSQGRETMPIYFGAFNKLYDESWQTAGVDEMLAFVKEKEWLSGVDIHIHHSSNDEITAMYEYANDRIREEQKILITEFSLVHWWKRHNLDTSPRKFTRKYKYPNDQKVYEYISRALNNPRPKNEWNDFLQMSPWFEERKNYLSEAYDLFASYESFHIATYSYRIDWGKNFTSNSMPWLLNNLIAGVTIEPDQVTGEDQFNYHFIDDFKTIQRRNK